MLAKPLEATIAAAKHRQVVAGLPAPRVVFMSPQGRQLTHERVVALKNEPGLVILCGRYEAVDQRLLDRCVDEEISLGDFVLSGGELPAMALMTLASFRQAARSPFSARAEMTDMRCGFPEP